MWLMWTACVEPPPVENLGPCDHEAASVEVAPPFGDYGELVQGASLWCGDPPQGGAPYSPFRMRVQGPEPFEDGAQIEMTAVDPADGAELAFTSLTMGLTCANVGESEGYWVGSEAHMRYTGWGLDELAERDAEVTITAIALTDPAVRASVTVPVVLVTELAP
jgi:hypothetical protein